jgi:hypothetical protein
LTGADAVAGFIAAAKKTRIWDRESSSSLRERDRNSPS